MAVVTDMDAYDKFATAAMMQVMARPPKMKPMKQEEIDQLQQRRAQIPSKRPIITGSSFMPEFEELDPVEVAREAWRIADAMMAEKQLRVSENETTPNDGLCTHCGASLSHVDPLVLGRDWSLHYSLLIEPGEYTFKQRLVIAGVFRARKIEIQEEKPLEHNVVVTEIFGQFGSSNPVSGKPCGLHHHDGATYCNVIFQGGDEVVLRLKNTKTTAVRCTVAVSGRAS